TKPRPDLAQAWLLDRFVAWLVGKQSRVELNLPDRTWRDQTAWCWQVAPMPPRTGEVWPVILLDGIRIGSMMVCLIARTLSYVIGWAWAGWESSNTRQILLDQLPAPVVVVCDGQKGILLARNCWL
ncbi:IS256 family transposase, partial [Candidatus Saccharibacteria bacterium CG_4_10_14_0_2_um_filter_52_9]